VGSNPTPRTIARGGAADPPMAIPAMALNLLRGRLTAFTRACCSPVTKVFIANHRCIGIEAS